MAQDTLVTGSKLTAIANAIRTRGGTQAQLTLDEMPTAVANIPGGFDVAVCDGISFYSGLISGAPDLSSLDTSGFTSMSNMFYSCPGLTALDVSGFDTSNVTNMISMFNGCPGLTALDVSGFDTSNVTNMNGMFCGNTGLTSLDLSGFDTSKVTVMNSMFYGCTALTSLDLSGFDTSIVTSMRYMFYNCSLLTDIVWSQKSTVQPLPASTSTMGITSQMKFYVPDNLVNAYKSATNWSAIASQIYPISQLPASVAALYGIGE